MAIASLNFDAGSNGRDRLGQNYDVFGCLTINGTPGNDLLLGSPNRDVINGFGGNDLLIGNGGNDDLRGGGDRDRFAISAGDGIDTVADFGGVGTGINLSQAVFDEVDTLQFFGEGLIAESMLLTQNGADLEIAFEGVNDTKVILESFKLEDLDNLSIETSASATVGNILFDGQIEIEDSFDVVNANSNRQRVFNRDTVTFLNDLDNTTSGFENSDDVINAQGGDDILSGLSGNDLLRGEKGNDVLDGGTGTNLLGGGEGNDGFIINTDGSFDRIVDFEVGSDLIILQDGLTFAQLDITQVDEDTQIRYLGNPEPSALLENVEASSITEGDFLTAPLVPTFDSLTVFGDSLSDTANLFNLTGFFPPPPYFEGRFSNGPIWTDYFTDTINFGSDRTLNFAFGGATTGRDNGLDPLLEMLTGQEQDLPGLLDEIDLYTDSLAGSPADPNGLYVIWAGSNDLLNLPSDPLDIGVFLATSVLNVATAIVTLAAQGADTFLVPNQPNLGLIPRTITDGTSEQAEALSVVFNTGLSTVLNVLDLIPSIDIVPVDLFSLTQEVIDSPDGFGFTNVTDPLIEQVPPVDPGFFWWDMQHPTTAVQSLLAGVFQSTLFQSGYLLNGEVVDPLLDPTQPLTASAAPKQNELDEEGLIYSLGQLIPEVDSSTIPDWLPTVISTLGLQTSSPLTTLG